MFNQPEIYMMSKDENGILNDMNDTTIGTIKEEQEFPYSELTGKILSC